MTPESVMTQGREAIELALLLAAPLLLASLVVGVLVGLFQAATQINEVTLSFIPKLLGTLLMLVLGGHWLLRVIITFTQDLIGEIPGLIR